MSEMLWQSLGGAAGIGIVYLFIKSWNDKITKQLEERATKEACVIQHNQISDNLKKGDTRFERIEAKLERITESSLDTHRKLDILLTNTAKIK